MDARQLRKLLQQPESPKLDFKRELHLDNKRAWGELIKDLIAIANGNIDTANQDGYLIIGADDELKPNKTRDLFDVGTLEINQRDLLNKLQSKCQPTFEPPSCELVNLDGNNLLVITISASDFLYDLTSDLKAKDKVFKEGDVLLRRKDGEATYVATNQEASRIRRQKAHRHKVQKSDLYEKLTNPTFIAEKINTYGLSVFLSDYSKDLKNSDLNDSLDQLETLRLLQAAFQRAESTLAKDVKQLPSQLIGRLLFVQDSGVQDFLGKVKQYQEDQNVPWLEPLSSSLKPPIALLLHDDLKEHRKLVTYLTVDGTSSKLVSASRDGQLQLWNLEQLEHNEISSSSAQTHTAEVNQVLIVGDQYNQKIVSASADCTVKIWDIHEAKLLVDFKEHQEPVNSIALVPDSQRVISASDDCKLKVWSSGNIDGQPSIKEKEFEDLGTSIFLAADGQRAFFSTDRFINIWNLSTDSIYQIPAHEGRINTLYLFPEQYKLISASDDETVKIWEVEQEIRQLAVQSGYRSLSHLSITPDGKSIIEPI